MKLWLIKRPWTGSGWDEYYGFVIRAETAERAIEIANSKERHEWTVTEVPIDGTEEIILEDFLAG